jgi:hypothetical protein
MTRAEKSVLNKAAHAKARAKARPAKARARAKAKPLTCAGLEASVRARLRRLGASADVTVEVRPLPNDPDKTIGLSILRKGVLVQWLAGKLGELEREARLLEVTRDGGVRWTGGE